MNHVYEKVRRSKNRKRKCSRYENDIDGFAMENVFPVHFHKFHFYLAFAPAPLRHLGSAVVKPTLLQSIAGATMLVMLCTRAEGDAGPPVALALTPALPLD